MLVAIPSENGGEPIKVRTPQPCGTGSYGALLPEDLDEFSLVKGDYSMGLVPFCPHHGVNIQLLHGGDRCRQHKSKLANIAANKAARAEASESRRARQAWVAANGVQVVRRNPSASTTDTRNRPPPSK